jgi:hypothetical protein
MKKKILKYPATIEDFISFRLIPLKTHVSFRCKVPLKWEKFSFLGEIFFLIERRKRWSKSTLINLFITNRKKDKNG